MFAIRSDPSLISVIQGLSAPPVPADQDVSPGTMASMRWDIFALWQREEGDDGHEYVQECQLISPDHTATIQITMPFKFVASTQRNIMSLYGFPLATAGEHHLKLWLRSPQGLSEVATFPLVVTREVKPPAP